MFSPAWAVTWDLRLHLVLLSWVHFSFCDWAMCVWLHTGLFVAPFHDWKWFLITVLTMNNHRQKLPCFIWYYSIWGKQNKNNIKICFVFLVPWDVGKSGEGSFLKVTTMVIKRELIGAIYWMTWSHRTPGGQVGVLATFTSAVTEEHRKFRPPLFCHKRPWKGPKEWQYFVFIFVLFLFSFFQESMRPTFNQFHYILLQCIYLWIVLHLCPCSSPYYQK